MDFEWDENKNKANIKKHKIAFGDAAQIFFNFRVEKPSFREKENRCITIGEVQKRIITVVYTIRNENIRIISARKARKNEEKEYRSLQKRNIIR
ncbi:MAG: BrnT family toxin [Bacteroidetes bacterium]|nr:BrnT family toxin [Bacteroidota bacterium]MCH9029012.1 BrnT family toxin [Bacteroidota bacterium]